MTAGADPDSMRSITYVFALFLVGVFVLPFASSSVEAVQIGPPQQVVDAATGTPAVAWEDLAARPRDYRDATVRLRIQFHSRPESWNPLTSRFGSTDYLAVYAWADEQMPWFPRQYEAPRVRLFARRGTNAAMRMERAAAHERYEVEAVVRELHGRLPWVEIVSVTGLYEHVPEGAIIHASRAVRLMQEKKWTLALAELERADQAPLPDHASAGLQELVQACELGRTQASNR